MQATPSWLAIEFVLTGWVCVLYQLSAPNSPLKVGHQALVCDNDSHMVGQGVRLRRPTPFILPPAVAQAPLIL